jgi:hypothetical protein
MNKTLFDNLQKSQPTAAPAQPCAQQRPNSYASAPRPPRSNANLPRSKRSQHRVARDHLRSPLGHPSTEELKK